MMSRYASVFSHASQGNWPEIVKLLPIPSKVNVTCPMEGKTILMYAVTGGHENIVRKLVDYGADVNAISKVRGTYCF